MFQQYIERKYRHAKIDQGITFKLDPSLGYVELIFNSLQEEPTTGWSIYPHMKPCQVNFIIIKLLIMYNFSLD